MSSIIALAIKDMRLLSRDRLGLFFIVVFPVIMGVSFGLIGASFAPGSSSSLAMKVGVIDEDQTDMSRLFVRQLEELGNLELSPMERSVASESVRKRKLVAFIAVPKGFGESAGIIWAEAPSIELGVDPSRGAESGMLQGIIMQAMGKLVQARFSDTSGMRKQLKRVANDIEKNEALSPAQNLLLKGFLGTAEAFLGTFDQFNKSMAENGGTGGPTMELARIETVDVLREKSEFGVLMSKVRSQWDISFPAAMMWGVMACVAGFAVTMVKERTEGTLLRLYVAPISHTQILAGKAVACFLAVIGVITFMIVLGVLLGIQLASPALLVVAAVSVALCFVGLMMLMSVIGKTEQAVAGAGWAMIVVMCMFGGAMMPLAFLPPIMKTISHFSPVKWSILALEGAIWRGFSPAEMLFPCGVLLAIGAVTFAAGAAIVARTRI